MYSRAGSIAAIFFGTAALTASASLIVWQSPGMLLGAGNHDPARFPDPETLEITRKNAVEHLAFGKNWHFCMGAPLARFEYNLVLSRLLERAPDMTLVEDEKATYAPIILIRALTALWVHPKGTSAAV